MDTTESFEITKLSGQSIRFIVQDALDVDGDPIISFDTLTINLYDQNDTLSVTGTVEADPADSNTFFADIILPDVDRTQKFLMKAAGAKSGVQLRELGVVWIKPF